MAHLSPAQEDALTNFEISFQVFKTAKSVLESELRTRLESELDVLNRRSVALANAAVDMGVPITRLGDKGRRGMATLSFNTIRNFLNKYKNEKGSM